MVLTGRGGGALLISLSSPSRSSPLLPLSIEAPFTLGGGAFGSNFLGVGGEGGRDVGNNGGGAALFIFLLLSECSYGFGGGGPSGIGGREEDEVWVFR